MSLPSTLTSSYKTSEMSSIEVLLSEYVTTYPISSLLYASGNPVMQFDRFFLSFIPSRRKSVWTFCIVHIAFVPFTWAITLCSAAFPVSVKSKCLACLPYAVIIALFSLNLCVRNCIEVYRAFSASCEWAIACENSSSSFVRFSASDMKCAERPAVAACFMLVSMSSA